MTYPTRSMSGLLFAASLLIAGGCGRAEVVPSGDSTPQSVASEASPAVATAPAKLPAKAVEPTIVVAQAQKAEPEAKPEPGKDSAFPSDKGGKLIQELLRPGDGRGSAITAQPKKLSGPAAIERPAVPLPKYDGGVLRFPLKPADRPVRPPDLAEPSPLIRKGEQPKLPEEIRFSLQALERWPSPDSGDASPLAVMALYQPERASLIGPSGERSLEAALSAAMPARDATVPFTRFNLPDPFENRQVIRTTAVDEESSNPVVTSPRPLVK